MVEVVSAADMFVGASVISIANANKKLNNFFISIPSFYT